MKPLLHMICLGSLIVPALPSAHAQDSKENMVDQYSCKDVMRDSGSNRDVAIAFLHGYLLGRSGSSKFDLEMMQKRTDGFIDRCLDNPREKAVDAMTKVKS